MAKKKEIMRKWHVAAMKIAANSVKMDENENEENENSAYGMKA
jgi:hypothetical protein